MARPRFFHVLATLLLAGCSEHSPITGDTASVALPGPTAAVQSGDTPVTSTVADTDTSIAAALQIRSDNLGVYSNSSTLVSVIQGIGAWVLDSYNPRNATRRAFLEFSQPVAGSGPGGGNPIAVASGLYRVRMIAKCNLYGTTMQALAPGATMPCPLHIAFDVGTTKYALQMNPLQSAGEPAPETNPAQVTCTSPASGTAPCVEWRMVPSGTWTAPDGSTRLSNVARLIKYVTSKGSTTAVNQGDFNVSFAIRVTNP